MARVRGPRHRWNRTGTQVTSSPVTTEEILNLAERRIGLTRPQLLVLVAKSATVRHLATHEKYKDLFVLKGGTLLSNVYRSPRQSIADADYTYLDPENLKVPELEKALAINGEYGFYLYPEEGRWSAKNEMFDGKNPFSMEGIRIVSVKGCLGWSDLGLRPLTLRGLLRGVWCSEEAGVLSPGLQECFHAGWVQGPGEQESLA